MDSGAGGLSAAISTTGLRRAFGTNVAVHGLDLDVARGEIFGLVGPDGAGKTTTIRMISGLIDPDAGSATVAGRAATDPTVRTIIGLMPQRYSLYGDLSVGENLTFFRRLFGLSKADAAPRITRLLDLTRLAPFVDRRADDLSGGMYKKLALACALLHQPEVLLLDEPTNGVDPVSRRELWTLLGEFATQGMAVLVTTPYMDEAERCHRVGLLHQGRLLACGEPAALVRAFEHPVFRVEGGDPAAIAAVINGAPEISASSPTGGAPRIVVTRGRVETLRARLDPLGATLSPVRPTFEDVFLARLAEEDA
jgi:ABC-2 type transport system ATP-binding protein